MGKSINLHSDKESLVKVRDLTMVYDHEAVVEDINLTVPEGVRCAIVGPNGAGKSTLLHGMLGIKMPSCGQVFFWGQEYKQVSKRIAYVPQKKNVHWNFPVTVMDVVMMGRYQYLGLLKRPCDLDFQKAQEAMEIMKIGDLAKRQISQLSGGQKQRVFLARALCQEADLYLLDEPLTGVDERSEKIMMDHFINLQQAGKSIIAVHHDLTSLGRYFDYLVVLNKRLVANGLIDELDASAVIQKAFHSGC